MWKYHPFIDSRRNDEDFELMLQKVPFPYTTMNGPEYFNLPALLPQSAYFDDIKQEPCSDEAYELVKKVVDRYRLETQLDYCKLYLFSDVLLLADCMEGNRQLWYADTGLDLAQSVTLPSAAFKAMWKKTEVEHGLITSVNGGERLMKELTDGLQGGISVCFQPQATANNPDGSAVQMRAGGM